MVIEHVAWLVDDPNAVADWYCENLDMGVIRRGGPPRHTTFIADSAGKTMIEMYTRDDLDTPDYASMAPSLLHLAFYSEDVSGTRAKLLAAGATSVDEVYLNDVGDEMTMMRDPWGLALQVLKRIEPMH